MMKTKQDENINMFPSMRHTFILCPVLSTSQFQCLHKSFRWIYHWL